MTIKHKGSLYIFKSKHIHHLYNVDRVDRIFCLRKLAAQRAYLENNFVKIDDIKKSFFDMSFSANIRPEVYIPELSHRINSIYEFAHEIGYVPLFLTMTPPSYFKPTKLVKVKGKKNVFVVVDNPNFTGDYKNYTDDCRLSISDRFRKFRSDRVFKIYKPHYFSVYEPFIDGALHRHTVMFVHPSIKDRVIKQFKFYFQSSSHDVKSDFTDGGKGVLSYVMKYCLKSIVDYRTVEGREASDVAYWYLKHGLRRITTSRTLVPLFLYRPSRSKEYSMLEMTRDFNDGLIKHDIVLRNPLKLDYVRSDFKVGTITKYVLDHDGNVCHGVDLRDKTCHSTLTQNSIDFLYNTLI